VDPAGPLERKRERKEKDQKSERWRRQLKVGKGEGDVGDNGKKQRSSTHALRGAYEGDVKTKEASLPRRNKTGHGKTCTA